MRSGAQTPIINRPNRVIAVEITPPSGSVQTLMIARLYGIKGWGAFSSEIRVITPSISTGDQVPFYNQQRSVTLGGVHHHGQ